MSTDLATGAYIFLLPNNMLGKIRIERGRKKGDNFEMHIFFPMHGYRITKNHGLNAQEKAKHLFWENIITPRGGGGQKKHFKFN